MSLRVEYLDGGQGVYSEASGHLTGDELIRAVREVSSPIVARRPVLYTFLTSMVLPVCKFQLVSFASPLIFRLQRHGTKASAV
jgi:hypothetical protein